MRRQSQHGDAQWCRLTMVVCVAHVAQSDTHTHPKTQSPLPVHYYPHICVVCAHTCARTSARHGGGWHGWWLNVALATSFVGLAVAQHRSCGSLFGGFDCLKYRTSHVQLKKGGGAYLVRLILLRSSQRIMYEVRI